MMQKLETEMEKRLYASAMDKESRQADLEENNRRELK